MTYIQNILTYTQTLHVRYICLHWGGLSGQCRHIWHTWSVWDILFCHHKLMVSHHTFEKVPLTGLKCGMSINKGSMFQHADSSQTESHTNRCGNFLGISDRLKPGSRAWMDTHLPERFWTVLAPHLVISNILKGWGPYPASHFPGGAQVQQGTMGQAGL